MTMTTTHVNYDNTRDYDNNPRDYDNNTRDYDNNTRDYDNNTRGYDNPRDYDNSTRDYDNNTRGYDNNTRELRFLVSTEFLSHGEALERTGPERTETTIQKGRLGFTGALVRQGYSRLSKRIQRIKRIMFGWQAVQGPERGGRPATSWGDYLQKNLEAFGAISRKGKERK